MACLSSSNDIKYEKYHCEAINETVRLTRHIKIFGSQNDKREIIMQTECPKINHCQINGSWECPENVFEPMSEEAKKTLRRYGIGF